MILLKPTDPARQAFSAWSRRTWRNVSDRISGDAFATERDAESLTFLISSVNSPLDRRLPCIDPQLFNNKRVNLRLAIEHLDGILIHPGETFSFWRLVGPPSRGRGYLDGLTIAGGSPGRGVGGGLCQLSNALFWLSLHSDLTVIERHRHSFDLFPDNGRTVPFGTGATVVYNYKDLRLLNPTKDTFQFRFQLNPDTLSVRLLCSSEPAHCFELIERHHRFEQVGEDYFRSNEILRRRWSLTKELTEEKSILKNYCRCRYKPSEVMT